LNSCRLPLRHDIIRRDVRRLMDVLILLLIKGEGYLGIHLAFCFIITYIYIKRLEDFTTLNNIMIEIGSGNKLVRFTI
jgi:hypothetical protein